MNDLTTMLDRAAGPSDRAPVDNAVAAAVRGDLTRGHRALARRRRTRGATGLIGVAAAGALGLGTVRLVWPDDRPGHAVDTARGHRTSGDVVTLASQPLIAGPYTFDTTPDGWVVQGVLPSAVVIVPPDGGVDGSVYSFIGKLVIMFDGNQPTGQQVTDNGRLFWVRGDSAYTTITTATLPGEPDGYVSVQFPDDTGWTQDLMLQFLGSVHVGPGAEQAFG